MTVPPPKNIAEVRRLATSLLRRPEHHFIGGKLTAGSGSEYTTVLDPSTEEVLGEIQSADAGDMDRAIEAATGAQRAWFEIGPFERLQKLLELSDLLDGQVEILALLEALDSGNPVASMRKDIELGIKELRYIASLGLSLQGATIPSKPHRLHYTHMRPYGVVGRIIPFNHPARFFISKAAAPLIAGNGLVIKPPEQAPLTAIRLAELFNSVLPPGLVNVTSGGPQTGNALVRHPEVKRIAFTGSVATGMRIQASAAEVAVKSVSLELGGKNPMIVLADADLNLATEAAVSGMNLQTCQGQSCGSNSRILVHESRFDEYQSRVVDRLTHIRVGPAYDPEVDMGPLISESQYQRVNDFLESARIDGVEFALGGGRPTGLEHSPGYFVAPTVLSGPSPQSRVASEEIFGPVISLMPWRTLDEAVELANRVEYGLTASVWTHEINVAHRLAHSLDAGYVWINQHGPHYPGTPFGGMKSSGTAREESIDEIVSFCEVQAVHLDFA